MWPTDAIYLPWDIWAVSWIIAALWSNRTLKRPGFQREWLYRLVALAGLVLLFGVPVGISSYGVRFLAFPGNLDKPLGYPPLVIGWTMVGVTALSFVFAWWARIYLGRLWSGSITRKEGHHVVDSGPYRFVRHPIYTGIIFAAFATAIVMSTPRVYIGAALVLLGYWMKARVEERFLRAELGAQAYDAYAARTAMLVPFVKL
jgi:protein-S-isoprenylcysteine O-methyltransferase Ste14